jgi:methane/ammonia monooxygenase subunit B
MSYSGLVQRASFIFVLMMSMFAADLVLAHGERNQEPFLRTRTLHWYDIKYSVADGSEVNVNDVITMEGKFRLFSKWPNQIPDPERMYLNVNANGSTFVKLESWINGKPAIQSLEGELGRDYEFKLVLKARWEGTWHVHPMVNVRDTGGLAGPGIYITIKGSHLDFRLPATTLDGTEIEDLSTYGMGKVYSWHIFTAVLGVFWLLYWIAKPLLIPRWLMVKDGEYEDQLVTQTDTRVGLVLLAVLLVSVVGSAIYTSIEYPRTIPLQAGVAYIDPLKEAPSIDVDVRSGRYYVPGRTVIIKAIVTNTAELPIRLGEYTAANLRFLEKSVVDLDAIASSNFPPDLIAQAGLKVSDNSPLNPGESREITIEASDAAWEVERLTSLMNDPDNTLGALVFFYDSEGNRYISELFNGMIPVFDASPT